VTAPDSPEPGVHVGLREIYDKLTEVHGDVRVLKSQTEDVRKRLDAHDTEISSLDKWRYGLPIAAAPGLGAMIMSLLKSSGVA